MKRYIAVLELEADEEIIEADVYYNYSSNGKDYSIIGSIEFEEENKKTYKDGLNEAWELARNIILPENANINRARKNAFGKEVALFDIIRNYSASEVIKKIKEYEEIKAGDEVEHVDTYDRVIVTHVSKYTKHIDIMWEDGSVGIRAPIEKFKKTGRHFTEIEEVLERMKEDE